MLTKKKTNMKVYEKQYKGRTIKEVFMREEQSGLEVVREALKADGIVEVVNEYETFYGVSFDGWLKKGLEDMDCTYEVLSYNHWEGYPWDYIITVNK